MTRIAGTESAVLRELEPGLAKVCRLKDSPRELARLFTKYGFLDLTFDMPQHLLKNVDRPCRSTLRDLGFIGAGEDRFCLESLIEGIEESRCWLRLFLFGEPAEHAMMRIFDRYRKFPKSASRADFESTTFRLEMAISQLADGVDRRLPMTFTVQDACLTNSDAIWLASHAYL